ncbi:hypothetical protein GCM10009430_29500 [Aquimarina litoralis]|uniref:VanZ like family protein n=1 Tax=Aquimarina litoralis TaxID=584605 RepID=A0ABP3U5D1_9FLAO
MTDLLKLARIQTILVFLFIILKFIRPTVLNSSTYNWIKIVLLSLPNFFEAIIGTFLLTGIGLYINFRILPEKTKISIYKLYVLATILAGVYVITQELKIHNLGGNNVYDINDIIFSFIGLIVGYFMIRRIQPKIYNTNRD